MKLRLHLITLALFAFLANAMAVNVNLNFYSDGHKVLTRSVTAGNTYTIEDIISSTSLTTCREWSFHGWTTVAPVEGEAVASPATITEVTPHTNLNLYAVFTKNTTKDAYGKVLSTSPDDLTDGDFLIVTMIDGDYFALSNDYQEQILYTATSGYSPSRWRDTVYYDVITPQLVSDVSADGSVIGLNQPKTIVWAFTSELGAYYWKNKGDKRYLYPDESSNAYDATIGYRTYHITTTQRALLTTAQYPTSVAYSGGKWAFFDGNNHNVTLNNSTGTNYFVNYNGGKQYIFYLYKRQIVTIPLYTSYPGCSLWSINLNPGDGKIGTAEHGEVITLSEDGDVAGAGVTLPSATPADGTCEGWDFYGWTTDAPVEKVYSIPDPIYVAGSVFMPSYNNQTLYAVYVHTGTSFYDRITSSSEIESGGKYIIADYYQTHAISSTWSDGSTWTLTDIAPIDGVISSAANSIVWTFNGTYFVDENSRPLAKDRDASTYYSVVNQDDPVAPPFIFEQYGSTDNHLFWYSGVTYADDDAEYTRYINYRFYLYKYKSAYYSSFPHCKVYTVTLNACGGTVKDAYGHDVSSIQMTEEDPEDGILLPVATPKCPEEGWIFEGWIEGEDIGSTLKTQYTTLPAGMNYVPVHDGMKLYAVYKRLTNRYLMLSNPAQIVPGDKYLITNYASNGGDDMYDYVISSTVANTNYLSVAEVEAPQSAEGYYIDIDSLENIDQYIWIMDGVYSACTFQNLANGEYLHTSNSYDVGTWTNPNTGVSQAENWYYMSTSATATTYDVELVTGGSDDGFYFSFAVAGENKYLDCDVTNGYAYMGTHGNAVFVYRQGKEYTSWPHCAPFTVNFDGCGGTAGSTSLTEVEPYTGVVLPNAYANSDCSREDWTFAGWATKPINEETDVLSLDLMPAGITYHPGKNNSTLYAVYLKKEDSYRRINSMAELRMGVGYIIATTGNKALANTTTGNFVSAATIPTPTAAGVVNGEQPSVEWRLQGNQGEYVLYNIERGAYLSLRRSNQATLTATPEDNFQITYSQTNRSFVVRSNMSIVLYTNAKYLGYQNSYYTTVNQNNLVVLYFYQREAVYNSYPECVVPVEAIRWAPDNVILESYVLKDDPEMNYSIGTPEEQIDGTFKVMYDGEYLLPCTQVVVTWDEKDSKINVPYVIQGNVNASTKGGENCSTCDYVILPNANLTIDANKTVHNITIYEGGTLTIANNRTLKVHSLIMRRDDDTKAPQVIFGGANAMVQLKFDEIYFDTRIDEERWYWYTLPYDGQVKEVSYSNNAANGKSPIYFTDFWVKYYNGLLRAQDVNGSALADTYWQHVASADRDYTMQAGQGYIVGIANQKNVTQPDLRKHTKRVMRFTMRPNDLTWNAMEKNSSKVTLVEPSTCNESRYAVHAGWNLVGNPYLHNYGTGASGGSGLRNGAWTKEMDGELWTGFWILDESRDTDVPYVTIYTPNPERPSTGTYSQDFVAGRTIKPLEAVFVQINEGTQINFANANMNVASMPAYKRFMQPQGPVRTGVELTGLGYSDYTGVVLSDEYTTQYEIGADLVKYSNAGKLNLYTLNADNQQLAFNGLSEEDAVAPIPVGATIPATGEYTFAFDAERYNMSLVDTVMLIDYTEGTQTNLLYNNYTFTAEKGKNEGRFALLIRLAKEPQIVTNLDETYDADKPRKIIRDGILYIIRDDKMYNALGAEVK